VGNPAGPIAAEYGGTGVSRRPITAGGERRGPIAKGRGGFPPIAARVKVEVV